MECGLTDIRRRPDDASQDPESSKDPSLSHACSKPLQSHRLHHVQTVLTIMYHLATTRFQILCLRTLSLTQL